MINETFLNHLKPVELEFIQAFIYKLTRDRKSTRLNSSH